MLRFDRKQQNSVKQLSFNKKKIFLRYPLHHFLLLPKVIYMFPFLRPEWPKKAGKQSRETHWETFFFFFLEKEYSCSKELSI